MKKVTYTVPEGVVRALYILRGGDGGAAADGTPGAKGQEHHANTHVTPGQELVFNLGQGAPGKSGGQPGKPGTVEVWWMHEAQPDA